MKPKTKRQYTDHFLQDIERAEQLFTMLVQNGGYKNGGKWHKLRQPERRDLAEGIFFEAAAKFEAFARFSFHYAATRHFDVNKPRAEFIIGHIDSGTKRTMGWADPKVLADRGLRLFGVTGFYGRFNVRLSSQVRKKLKWAHLIRNRIAHDSSASKDFKQLVADLGVPARARGYMSIGRLLMDYPTTGERLFFQLLNAYTKFGKRFRKYG